LSSSALAVPYIETLTLVATAVAEARGAAAGGDKEDVAFARNCLATGMDHLRGLSRRYSSSREARDFAEGLNGVPRPIVADPRFVAALVALADAVEASADLLGRGAARIAEILRAWANDKSPSHALELAIIADTVMKAEKKKGSSR
jgi:hypothetical protein